LGGIAARSGTLGVARERGRGGRALRLALEHARDRARDARLAPRLALVLAGLVGVLRALAGALLDPAFLRGREVDAGAPRLRKPDGDRLLGRSRAVLAAADLADFLAHELARLGARRLAGASVLAGLLDGAFLRHEVLPIRSARFRSANGHTLSDQRASPDIRSLALRLTNGLCNS